MFSIYEVSPPDSFCCIHIHYIEMSPDSHSLYYDIACIDMHFHGNCYKYHVYLLHGGCNVDTARIQVMRLEGSHRMSLAQT